MELRWIERRGDMVSEAGLPPLLWLHNEPTQTKCVYIPSTQPFVMQRRLSCVVDER